MKELISIYSYIQQLNLVSVVIRIVLAVFVGGIIGTERGKHGSAAGLRTHILVCVGAAMTSLTAMFMADFQGFQGDIFRLSAQVISGIGFLGAGMIVIKNNTAITGLTTAAGMWATASIGVALGYGFYSGAFVGMLACVFTAAFLKRLEKTRKANHLIYAEISDFESAGDIIEAVRAHINSDMPLEIIPAKSGIAGNMGVLITLSRADDYEGLRAFIRETAGIQIITSE